MLEKIRINGIQKQKILVVKEYIINILNLRKKRKKKKNKIIMRN